MRPAFRPAAVLIAALLSLMALPAAAQELPQLIGRVVDQAELLSPDQEAQIGAKLEALERNSSRQLVVVTVPNLQGYSVEDFGFALGEQWKIGNEEADNGAILLVAVADRRVRIEVGDGLEGIIPDAMAWFIIRDRITPRFAQEDYAGGISAGVDGIVEQLQAPLEIAEERARAAAEAQRNSRGSSDDGWFTPLLFVGLIIVFIILPAVFGRRGRGRVYRRRGSGLGDVILGSAIDAAVRSSGNGSGGSWGGGGGGWSGGGGFSGGGFSGGGGSFGGGGASGSW